MVSKRVLLGLGLLVLLGCQTHRTVKENIHREREAADTALEEGRARPERYVVERQGLYLGSGKPIDRRDEEPTALRRPIEFRRPVRPMTIEAFAAQVSRLTGLRVMLTPDAIAQIRTDETNAGVALNYSGKVSGLFDAVTGPRGLGWRFDAQTKQVLVFYRTTKVFQLGSIGGIGRSNNTISNTTGGSSGGGGQQVESSRAESGQRTEFAVESNVISEIGAQLKGLVGEAGAYSITSAGLVTVTAPIPVLSEVEELVRAFNVRALQTVEIEVALISVDLDDENTYGLDLDGVREALNGRTALTIGGPSGIDPSTSTSLGFAVIDNDYNFGGSEAIVQALAKQGEVAAKSTTSLRTTSGQPAPFQVSRRTSYVANEQADAVANVGLRISRQLGSVVTGTTLTVTPVVMDDRQILLQLAMDESTLRQLRRIGGAVGEAGGTLEAPEVDQRNFFQRTLVQSGQWVLLTGFDQERSESDARGTGVAKFFGLGGRNRALSRRTTLVLLVRPKLI